MKSIPYDYVNGYIVAYLFIRYLTVKNNVWKFVNAIIMENAIITKLTIWAIFVLKRESFMKKSVYFSFIYPRSLPVKFANDGIIYYSPVKSKTHAFKILNCYLTCIIFSVEIYECNKDIYIKLLEG